MLHYMYYMPKTCIGACCQLCRHTSNDVVTTFVVTSFGASSERNIENMTSVDDIVGKITIVHCQLMQTMRIA